METSEHATADGSAEAPVTKDDALAFGGPIVVFDGVCLAFDEKVILREVSFTLQTGHTKIFLGASGAGKSTILRLALGLLKPDAGRIFVNGEEIGDMSEDDLMRVRPPGTPCRGRRAPASGRPPSCPRSLRR